MVPQDEPQRAYQLIFNWLEGKPIDPTWPPARLAKDEASLQNKRSKAQEL